MTRAFLHKPPAFPREFSFRSSQQEDDNNDNEKGQERIYDEEDMMHTISSSDNAKQTTEEGQEKSTTTNSETRQQHCIARYFNLGGVAEARGYAILAIGRGGLVMSNIVLSTALIELASIAAGCTDDDGNDNDAGTCEKKINGFTPASLISNIAVISGLLSALLMPLLGAIVDYTPYRRLTGIMAATTMTVIQVIQIGTTESTWFFMAMLQAISGFLYQAEMVSTYAYLPEVARKVGETKMTKYSSKFTIVQFMAQNAFLILVGLIGFAGGVEDVLLAQISQGVNTIWSIGFFYWGWKLLPTAPARHTLPEGQSLLSIGFKQNWQTIKTINRTYNRGLKWFLLSIVFAEAAVNAFTTVSVIFLGENLGLNGTEIILFFLVTLFATAIGSKLAVVITKRTDPNTSWQLSMISLFVVANVGAFALDGARHPNIAYLWGVAIGVMLGWYYPTSNVFFSMCLPKGCETEMSGFYVYCSQALVWLPPMVFSILVENQVQQKYGVMATSSFALIAVGFVRQAAPWDEIIQEAQKEVVPGAHSNIIDATVQMTHDHPDDDDVEVVAVEGKTLGDENVDSDKSEENLQKLETNSRASA